MHKVKSYFLTFLFAACILWAGYVVIMESGKKVLENETIIEETSYEDTGSNIFYGKIEEDIELFPWNYYPGKKAKKGWDNKDAWGNMLHPFFQYNMSLNEFGEIDETKMKAWQNICLEELIAHQAGVSVGELEGVYGAKNSTIMDDIRIVENSVAGTLYFYQDSLELEQTQYQVRIAMRNDSIISFLCAEKRSGERSKGIWEAGKAKLVDLLEEEETRLEDYYQYMVFVYELGDVTLFGPDGERINCYLESLRFLDDILLGRISTAEIMWDLVKESSIDSNEADAYEASEIKAKEDAGNSQEEISGDGEGKKSAAIGVVDAETGTALETDEKTAFPEASVESVENAAPGFSYQIVDLGEMILLLMQGENTIGVYYDPIAQKFCGYNYFYGY